MNRRKHRPGDNRTGYSHTGQNRSEPENRGAARPDSSGKPRHAPKHGQRHTRDAERPSGRASEQAAGKRSVKGGLWLYGQHACLAALANPERYIHRLVLTRESLAQLEPSLPSNSPQPEILDRARLDSLLPPGAVHQGIALQVEPLDDPGVESLAQPPASGSDIVLLLDQVTDPRNIGAILRSAAAFGARALIVTDRHAPEVTGALAKAASGGLEAVPVLRVGNLVRAMDLLAEYGFWRVGLAANADRDLAAAVKDVKRLALVLGAEDEGLRRLTAEHCDFLAHLPMPGSSDAMVESLNVSVAASIALYEAARRPI